MNHQQSMRYAQLVELCKVSKLAIDHELSWEFIDGRMTWKEYRENYTIKYISGQIIKVTYHA
jgi:hypothetical protein